MVHHQTSTMTQGMPCYYHIRAIDDKLVFRYNWYEYHATFTPENLDKYDKTS